MLLVHSTINLTKIPTIPWEIHPDLISERLSSEDDLNAASLSSIGFEGFKKRLEITFWEPSIFKDPQRLSLQVLTCSQFNSVLEPANFLVVCWRQILVLPSSSPEPRIYHCLKPTEWMLDKLRKLSSVHACNPWDMSRAIPLYFWLPSSKTAARLILPSVGLVVYNMWRGLR